MKQNLTCFVTLVAELLRACDTEILLSISKRNRIGSVAQTRLASTHFLSQEYLSGQHSRSTIEGRMWSRLLREDTGDLGASMSRPGHLGCLMPSLLPPGFGSSLSAKWDNTLWGAPSWPLS